MFIRRAPKLVLFVLWFLPAGVVPANADYYEGEAAYKRGDYATALKEVRPLAEQGHANAQALLGTMYAYGQGISQNFAEALKWIRKGAEQENVEGMYMLGMMSLNGIAVRKNHAEALKWIRPAAEQGFAQAQYQLGFLCQIGKGVPQDYTEVFKWYRRAAEQGHLGAQFAIGLEYYFGKNVVQDYAEALKWVRMAAENGERAAQAHVGRMYLNGEGVRQDYAQAHMWLSLAIAQGLNIARGDRDTIAKNMTPADLSKAESMAREWLAIRSKREPGAFQPEVVARTDNEISLRMTVSVRDIYDAAKGYCESLGKTSYLISNAVGDSVYNFRCE